MRAKSVLISGAGIAGPTLAFWLNAAGFKTTIVERAPALRAGGYVLDFWGLGYDIAERMGLANKLKRVGYSMREMRIVDARGERIAGFGTRVFRELTGGRFVTLARADLSRLLFETVEDQSEVLFGDEIICLEEGPNHTWVQFEHAGARTFDLVVGADGLHSNVRRLAFGPQQQFEKDLGYVVAAFETQHYRPRDEDVYIIYSEPGQMAARFTLHDDRALFLLVFIRDDEPAPTTSDLAAQKAMLRQRFGGGGWECGQILACLDRAEDLYFDPVAQIKMPSWSRGRVALVGDAAFCVSLMAGQGSALAMTAAYVLAGELARSRWRAQRSVQSLRNTAPRVHRRKAEGRGAFLRRLCAENPIWTVLSQSGRQGVRHSGSGKIRIGPGHCGYAQTSRLFLAGACKPRHRLLTRAVS